MYESDIQIYLYGVEFPDIPLCVCLRIPYAYFVWLESDSAFLVIHNLLKPRAYSLCLSQSISVRTTYHKITQTAAKTRHLSVRFGLDGV